MTQLESIGHSSKYLDHSQKTLRPPWCPKLVTGLTPRLLLYFSMLPGTTGVTRGLSQGGNIDEGRPLATIGDPLINKQEKVEK